MGTCGCSGRSVGEFRRFRRGLGLYDGYVAETGETEVEVTLRSAAETVTPGSPKYFDTLYFAGADEGMPFRLVEAEVRPVFCLTRCWAIRSLSPRRGPTT